MTLLLALTLLLGFAGAARAEPPTDAREVNIGLGSVESGHGNEILIERLEGANYQSLFPQPVLVKDAAWHSVLAPGSYRLRIRALDKRGVPGPWSEFVPFKVAEPQVELGAPDDGAEVKAGPVPLAWSALPSAKAYQLTVSDERGQTVVSRKVSEATVRLTLPLGAKYRWKVQAFAGDDQPGEDGDWQIFTVRGGALALPTGVTANLNVSPRTLSWRQTQHAESYTAVVERRDPEKSLWHEVVPAQAVEDTTLELPGLKPGRYRVTVIAKAALWDDSPPRTKEFRIAESDPMSSVLAQYHLRLYGRFLPTYWRHDATSAGAAGISFAVIAADASQFGVEAWSKDRNFGLALDYRRIVTTLFNGSVQATGDGGQQPLPLPQEDLALTGKFRVTWRFLAFEAMASCGQTTTYFFYNDSPETITDARRQWPYVAAGGRLSLLPTSRTEWSASFERVELLHGADIKLQDTRVYRAEGSLVRRLSSHLAVHATMDLDYKALGYATAGPEGSGQATDLTEALGLGLDLLF